MKSWLFLSFRMDGQLLRDGILPESRSKDESPMGGATSADAEAATSQNQRCCLNRSPREQARLRSPSQHPRAAHALGRGPPGAASNAVSGAAIAEPASVP